MQTCRNVSLFLLALCAAIGMGGERAIGADHRDSPRTLTDPRLDINDVYAFRSSTAGGRVAIAVTLFPDAGLAGEAIFKPGAAYEIVFDNNGDAREDAVIQVSFSQPNRFGVQNVSYKLITARTSRLLGRGVTNRPTSLLGGGTATSGLFDDPFFFDLAAFNAFKISGDPAEFDSGVNFFEGFNTLAMVIDVPPSLFGLASRDRNFGVFARTIDGGAQFDRMGIPAVNTVFIPTALKDDFNSGDPFFDEVDFFDVAVDVLTDFPYFNTVEDAEFLADFVFPDYLPLDLRAFAGFPNGRRLADDVIDTELSLVSAGGITTDNVDNDSVFRARFPYLGVPNN